MTDFHRTNINLYVNDATWLKNKYGYGWTEKVRDIVHGYVQGMDALEIVQDINLDDYCAPTSIDIDNDGFLD